MIYEQDYGMGISHADGSVAAVSISPLPEVLSV